MMNKPPNQNSRSVTNHLEISVSAIFSPKKIAKSGKPIKKRVSSDIPNIVPVIVIPHFATFSFDKNLRILWNASLIGSPPLF